MDQDPTRLTGDYFPQPPKTPVKPIRCPACNGRGNFRAGFYEGGPHDDDDTLEFVSAEETAQRVECKSCKGDGILWERVAQ